MIFSIILRSRSCHSLWAFLSVVVMASFPLGSSFAVSPASDGLCSRRHSCRLNMVSGATNIESPRQFVLQGMQRFRQGDIDGSIELFDRAESLDSSLRPFLWQRGISYYYADQFQKGSDQVTSWHFLSFWIGTDKFLTFVLAFLFALLAVSVRCESESIGT
jgi:hypothetical protein